MLDNEKEQLDSSWKILEKPKASLSDLNKSESQVQKPQQKPTEQYQQTKPQAVDKTEAIVKALTVFKDE